MEKIKNFLIKKDLKPLKPQIIQRDFDFKTSLRLINEISERVYGHSLIIDEKNYAVIRNLTRYFNGRPEFEENGYNLNKGILLVGKVGTGKTFLMELFMQYSNLLKDGRKFKIVTSEDIVNDYMISGVTGIEKYMQKMPENNLNIEFHKSSSICIDDLGVENSSVKHYGTEEEVIPKVIFSRHRLFKHGILTHATTNLDAQQLKEKYGDRIRSRFREMFNIIVVEGSDRRK